MPKLREQKPITLRSAEAMKAGEIIYDGTVRGLGLRYRGGDKQFVLRARVHGREKWFTIGALGTFTPDQARGRAREILGDIAKGVDPSVQREKDRQALTLTEIAERWFKEHCGLDISGDKPKPVAGGKTRARTAVEYERVWRRALKPEFGKRRAVDITTADVAALHTKMAATPRNANFSVSCLSSMLGWASDMHLCPKGFNPTESIERYDEHRRTKALNADETKKLVGAIQEVERREGFRAVMPSATAAIKFLMLAGMRPLEALRMRWADVDLDNGVVQLSDEASKTGARLVPLSAAAVELLRSVPQIEGNPYVFTGKRKGEPLSSLKSTFRIIRETAGLADVDDLCLYSATRHSFGSALGNAGLNAFQVQRAMGHKNIGTSARYVHLDLSELRSKIDSATGSIGAAVKGSASRPVDSDGE